MASRTRTNLFEPPPAFSGLNPQKTISIELKNLPHWRQEGATYFVTIRLSDSLPKERLAELRDYRNSWLETNPPPHTEEQSKEFAKTFTSKIENWLDVGSGSCLFKDGKLADIVNRAFYHFDEERYQVFASVVMANHAHLIVKPFQTHSLDEIITSWFKFPARQIRNCGVSISPVWASEPYDRIIRDLEHLQKVIQYIGGNPKKAGVSREQTFCQVCESWRQSGWGFVPE